MSLVSGGTGDKAAEAMHAVADAVTQCKFEATNPAADEVVLYKILQVANGLLPHFCAWMSVCVCVCPSVHLSVCPSV